MAILKECGGLSSWRWKANKEIKEQEIINLIDEGGRAIGLGTFRGVFGKFYIDMWE